jgi:hypothetical protein
MKDAANPADRQAPSHPDFKRVKSKEARQGTGTRTRPARVSPSLIAKLVSHLTERDRQIAADCYEHHVLTTDQIARLHFTSQRTATDRLNLLYELRVLDRFRPVARAREGSRPYHWILDEAGALITADAKGIEPSELHYTHERGLRIAASRNLTHHVEANEFFTRLAVEANASDGELAEWYGVRTLAHTLAGSVVPDGYGVVLLPGSAPLHLLLELDRATEATRVLVEKARRYAEVLPRSSLSEHRPLVLIAVPNELRARSVRDALAGLLVSPVVSVWNAHTTGSALAAVQRADDEVHRGQARDVRLRALQGRAHELLRPPER